MTNQSPSGPILVFSHEIVGEQMAGPGIRYYHLARVLAKEFIVTLAVPAASGLRSHPDFSVLPYQSGWDEALNDAIRSASVLILPAASLAALRLYAVVPSRAPLVVDGYNPFLAEMFFLQQADYRFVQSALAQAYLAGDFFLCASERQRDWWLGLLEASGRLNAHTYRDDPTLRRLVDLVPFGLPETPPSHTRQVVKGVWPGIGADDRVILWGGGVWPWLDPLTAVRAMEIVHRGRPEARLIFPGMRHPNPETAASIPTLAPATRALADQLGLTDRAVFFGDWAPYADWQNVLLESDVALTLHDGDSLEARLAYRSRVLEYFWAGLPTVAARGDAISELIEQHQLGLVVPGGDAPAVAEAILRLLDTPAVEWQPRFEQVRRLMTWEQAAQPLIRFCRQPYRAPDKGHLADQPESLLQARVVLAQAQEILMTLREVTDGIADIRRDLFEKGQVLAAHDVALSDLRIVARAVRGVRQLLIGK
jgi:glycosyltransferase involved in cell wall biosynthesis